MYEERLTDNDRPRSVDPIRLHDAEDHDLDDLLQELRILLQGVQVLTAFLIILPFNDGFARIDQIERWVYLATFMFSMTGLVLVSAPAAQHRIQRPLADRTRFKNVSSRLILIGLAMFSVALVLSAQLVSNEVVGFVPSIGVAAALAILIVCVWWLMPALTRRRFSAPHPGLSGGRRRAPPGG